MFCYKCVVKRGFSEKYEFKRDNLRLKTLEKEQELVIDHAEILDGIIMDSN